MVIIDKLLYDPVFISQVVQRLPDFLKALLDEFIIDSGFVISGRLVMVVVVRTIATQVGGSGTLTASCAVVVTAFAVRSVCLVNKCISCEVLSSIALILSCASR